ncbi:MAG TPA: NAD(P)-binding protein, partial [Dehalococcoidia bacterium]|nr:NAD(P)-binding protein [Dehalococcoidia bacterium]
MEVKDSYDAVVIGGGIGGLTCGALLARNRMSVLIAEQGSKPGGCCTSFEHRGYTFDNGLSALTGCEIGGAIYQTLEELELRDEIEFIKMEPAIRVIGSDYEVRISSAEGLEDRLIEIFP